jgi:hypothetical protein
MADVLFAIVFMTLVVGVAAGILFLVDRLTLTPETPVEDRKALVARRTARWQTRYRKVFAVMAAVSIPINLVAIVTKSEPLMPNVLYVVLAVAFLLSPWNEWRKGNDA